MSRLSLWIWALLLALLATASPTATADWLEARTQKFIAYSEGNEKSIRSFVEKLERFDQVLQLATGINTQPGGVPLKVYLVRNPTVVRSLFMSQRKVAGLAGFYRPSIRGSLAVIDRSEPESAWDLTGEVILFHEYTHHFMLKYAPFPYPAWYSEGFAEYYSSTKFLDDGAIEIGRPANSRIPSLELSRWIKTARLLDPEAKYSREEGFMLYAQGWLLTHYFNHKPERGKQFANYLRLLGNRIPYQDSVKQAFGIDVEGLDEELRSYYRTARKKGLEFRRIVNFATEVPPIEIPVLPPAESDGLMLDVRVSGLDRETDHADLIADVDTLVRKYPNDAGVLTLAAEAYFSAERITESESLIDRALAANPQWQRALAIKGAITLSSAAREGEARRGNIKSARSWILKANKSNPDDPLPLYYFFQSFLQAGEVPSENAFAGIVGAHELAPNVSNVTLTLGAELLRRGRKTEVVNLLKPIAYSPHDGDAAKHARELIKAADPNGAALADAPDVQSASEASTPTPSPP